MPEDHAVAVGTHHSGTWIHGLFDLMEVRLGGDPGSDVQEPRDTGDGQEPGGTLRELPVARQTCLRRRYGLRRSEPLATSLSRTRRADGGTRPLSGSG